MILRMHKMLKIESKRLCPTFAMKPSNSNSTPKYNAGLSGKHSADSSAGVSDTEVRYIVKEVNAISIFHL